MRFAFHQPPIYKKPDLLPAVIKGAARFGDHVEGVAGFDGVRDVDGCIVFGIGGLAKAVYDAYRAAGKITVLIDKGYVRWPYGYLRIAVNDFQPLAYLGRLRASSARFAALNVEIAPYRARGEAILFDGASDKFCRWKQLGECHAWGAAMVAAIRANSDRPIIYRPRPVWQNAAVPIAGTELSQAPLADDLARAAVVVSYGGNIGWDAVVAGVPHFAIWDSIARPLSETAWDRVGFPRVPSDAERWQWCCDVAHCQWTIAEFQSGEAWDHVRQVI